MKAFISLALVGLAAAMPRKAHHFRPRGTNSTQPGPTGTGTPIGTGAPIGTGVPIGTSVPIPISTGTPSTPSTNTTVWPAANQTIYFAGAALRSGSDFHNGNIAANGFAFWIGKDTAVYTPPVTGFNSTTNSTADTLFAQYAGSSTLWLSVSVPGGQGVYVDEDGALKYTQAHSGYNGGSASGFAVSGKTLTYEGSDFIAVPAEAGVYQVYAASKAAKSGEGFSFYVNEASTPSWVWQYN